jgi:hypothetical protein
VALVVIAALAVSGMALVAIPGQPVRICTAPPAIKV